MRFRLILHPFLFGIAPVLSLFWGNIGEASFSETYLPAAAALILTLLIISIFRYLLGDSRRAAVITSGILVICFAFFDVYLAVREWPVKLLGASQSLDLYVVLGILIFGLGCYTFILAKTSVAIDRLNGLFNIVSALVIGIPLFNIVVHKAHENIDWSEIQKQQFAETFGIARQSPSGTPDIYYIILDRYAGSSTLNIMYGFDNHEFLDYLKAKGFYVASKSAANYLTTAQSLASSLNLQYVNYLADYVDPDSNNWIPIQALLQDHKVGRFLKANGYKFIHIGSWWQPTRKNKFADRNIVFSPLTEMFYVLYGKTMLQPVTSKFGILDFRRDNWRGARRQFQNMDALSALQGPKFVFAHFLLPHEPYVFTRDGAFVTVGNAKDADRDSYIEQLIYTNRMVKRLIDRLLTSRKNQPIVVLQADEGPYPRRSKTDPLNFKWREATNAEIEQKLRILNSYYLPGSDKRALYASISPVNSFRMIFNLYFNTQLSLLPDESFAFSDYRHPYKLFNITERLTRN